MRHYFDVSLNNMKFPGSLMIFSTFIRTQSTPNPNSETMQDQSVASALLAALITGIQTPWGIFPLMLCNGPCVRIIGILKNQLFEHKLHVLRAVRTERQQFARAPGLLRFRRGLFVWTSGCSVQH